MSTSTSTRCCEKLVLTTAVATEYILVITTARVQIIRVVNVMDHMSFLHCNQWYCNLYNSVHLRSSLSL